MLSAKNLSKTRGQSKTIQPGHVCAKIHSISLQNGYNVGSYQIVLQLETVDMGPEFEGFLIDKDNPSGPRYKGQVGRIRLSPYAFDVAKKNGEVIDRDKNMVQALFDLALGLGKEQEISSIQAPNIEAYVSLASLALSGSTFYNWCIGGKEYSKGGYTKYDLFLPTPNWKNPSKNILKTEYPYEPLSVESSSLLQYDPNKHILRKKVDAVQAFEPSNTGYVPVAQSGFEL